MRRIESLTKRERKQKRNGMIIGIILIVLMASSTVRFIFAFGGGGGFGSGSGGSGGSEPDLTYNGIDFFRNSQGLWGFSTSLGSFSTTLEPGLTESTELDFEVLASDFFNKPLYFVFENQSVALSEVGRNLGSLALRAPRACLNEIDCPDDSLPIKTCEDNVIIMKASEEINAYKENKCIFLEGTDDQLLLLADRLVFEALGIQ